MENARLVLLFFFFKRKKKKLCLVFFPLSSSHRQRCHCLFLRSLFNDVLFFQPSGSLSQEIVVSFFSFPNYIERIVRHRLPGEIRSTLPYIYNDYRKLESKSQLNKKTFASDLHSGKMGNETFFFKLAINKRDSHFRPVRDHILSLSNQ